SRSLAMEKWESRTYFIESPNREETPSTRITCFSAIAANRH
ncbi:MAG: hypothetical protein ACI87E_004711, partial [Mariniblastus sp.]